jgi:hypothetical protein
MADGLRKVRGLAMPADGVISPAMLKKQLLFFDQVTLPDPSDRSLIADGEIQDTYPDGMKVVQAGRAPFPQVEDYTASFEELLAGTEFLQHLGIVQVLRPDHWKQVDPWARLHVYQAAISDQSLVKAAVPDLTATLPVKIPNGVIYGLDVVRSGWQRPSQLRSDPPYKISDVDDDWNILAYLRVARTLKYLRVAQVRSAVPIAWDDPTRGILVALGGLAFRELPTPDILAATAIALDVVDTQELLTALEDMPWKDVLKVRREVLPHVATYRATVLQTARRVRVSEAADVGKYRDIIELDRRSLEAAQRDLRRAWQGLMLSGALKMAAGAAGATGLLLPTGWLELLGAVLTGIAVGGGALSREIREVLQAHEHIHQHPLFVLDRSLPRPRHTPR